MVRRLLTPLSTAIVLTTTQVFNPSDAFTPLNMAHISHSKSSHFPQSIETKHGSSSNDNDDGNNVSGSFFNQVPAPSESEPKESKDASFDDDLTDLLRRRKSKPLAKTPSTLGGIPTSKATGFGGKQPPKAMPKVSVSANTVEIGRKMNDINNPEYDDQGYTLYADERTGEKKRVFEALVDYPCEFTMKIVGANEGNFAAEMVQIVADSCAVETDKVRFSERMKGKWNSVTVHAPVKSSEMLYTLYENIDRDPRVKFKF